MSLLPIKIAPGFFKNGTQYQAKNRWYDGNLVRFSEGRVRPIGGWQRLTDTQITQKGGVKKLTITTPGSGYHADGGTLSAVGGPVPFAGTYTVSGGGISTVKITDPGSGYTSVPTIVLTPTTGSAGSGAVITATNFFGVDPIRGLHSWRLSTGARYLAVGSVQSLRIWDGSQSAGVNAPIYDITPPTSPGSALPFHQQADFEIAGLGFGALQYGGDTGVTYKLSGSGGFTDPAYTGAASGGDIYGTPRYSAVDPNVQDADAFRDNFASCVSFDNFGDDLLACHSGEGTIWYWSFQTGGSVTQTFTTASGITELLPVGPTPASIQPYTYIPDNRSQAFTTASGITALTNTGASGNPANTYIPANLSQTFTSSSGAEEFLPHSGPIATLDTIVQNGTHTESVFNGIGLSGGSGSGITVDGYVSSGGDVNNVTIQNAGTGYRIGDVLTFPNPPAGGATCRVAVLTTSTTSGQWECGNPASNATLVEKTWTNVSQTSTSGSGSGAKFTVVTQLGLVVSSCSVWHYNTRIDCGDTSNLSVGMLVHGLYGDMGHHAFGSFIQPYIASITNSTTIQLTRANGSASGSYHYQHLSFQDPLDTDLKSVTVTTAGSGYAENDTIVLTDPGSAPSTLPHITGTETATLTVGPTDTTLTSTGHTLLDGHRVQVSTTGSLPGGLSASTDLYIRDRTANTFRLTTSLNGTALAFTSPGSGTHTWTNEGANLAFWQAGPYNTVSQTSTSGGGQGAQFTITASSGTYLSAATVTTAGSGYAVGDTILVTDPGNTVNVATLTVGTLDPTITSTGHGLIDTNKVQVSSSGALPVGLTAATDLFVRDKTANTFKLAATSNGTALALTTVGSGTHTWTISGANLAPWQSGQTHTNVIQTSTSSSTTGSGSGAKFTVVTSTVNNLGSVAITSAGSGYSVNDTILLTDPGNTVNVATITVKAIDSTITSTAPGLIDGSIIQVSSLGALPVGVPPYTDLYVRDKTTDTFKLATSNGGTALAFTTPSYGENTWESRTGGAISFNNATQTATAPIALQDVANSTGVPVGSNVAVLVTPERHIMILAPDGAHRTIQWGSQESLTDFSPSLLNTAGDLDLQTKGRIIGGFKTRYGVLIFTTSDVWRTNYLGPPYVYGVERLTEGAGPVGMKSIAGSADFVAWMSRGRFWSYTGGYIKELSCEVADYVFADINLDVEGLIAAGHNGEFGEISWFYPKEGDSVCTRYVTYSYREGHWVTGELERVAMEPSDALGYPVWAGSDGYLYRHEMDPDTHNVTVPRDSSVTAPADIDALSGKANRVVAKGVSTSTHPNVATEDHLCYAETGAIEIAGGNKMMSVNSILTDTDAGSNGLRMKIVTGKTPDAPGDTHGPFTLESDGYTDCRFTDRQAILRVESPFDQEWRFGEVRFEAAASGKR